MEDNDSSQMAGRGASLSTLPEEVLLLIFSLLPPEDLMFGVRATCQRFYDLSQNSGLWKQVVVTRICPDSPVELQPGRTNHSSEFFYRKLLQQNCIRSGSGGRDTLPVRMLVRSVEERGDIWPSCSVTGTITYPNLESLTLIRKYLPSVAVWVKLPKLKHLQLCLSHCLLHDDGQNSRGQLVIDLFQNIQNLTELQSLILRFSCSRCKHRKPSISCLSDIQASMKDYFLTGPKLRQIEIDSFVNDEIFRAILTHCSKLEDLQLNYIEGFTPESFCTSMSENSKLLLSSLAINTHNSINDRCLETFSNTFSKIKSVTLQLTKEVTDNGLELFLKNCAQLRHLKLETLCGQKMGSKTSENLQSLCLLSISFPLKQDFTNLCQSSQNLREIQLTYCNNTDMITMTNSCRLLEKVTLHDCSHVDSKGVAYLMKNLPRLQELVIHLAYPHLFQLEQLSPSRKRTRAGGLVLENQPPTEARLCSLELHNCQELTAVGVSALAVLCPNLRRLMIHTTNGVNDHTVKVISRSLPNLQYLRLERSGETDRQNQLTAACLHHVQRWGTRLQSLKLMTRYRSFTIAALVKLLACSSTLVECVVPLHTEKSPGVPEDEIIQKASEQLEQKLDEGKLAMPRLFNFEVDSLEQKRLGIRICQC